MSYANDDDRRAYQRNWKKERRRRAKAEADGLVNRLENLRDMDDLERLRAILNLAGWLIVNDRDSKGVVQARGLVQIVNAELRVLDAERLVGEGRCRHEPFVAPTVMQPKGETAEEFEARLEPPPEEWCDECRAPRKVVRMAVTFDDVDEWRRRSGM